MPVCKNVAKPIHLFSYNEKGGGTASAVGGTLENIFVDKRIFVCYIEIVLVVIAQFTEKEVIC